MFCFLFFYLYKMLKYSMLERISVFKYLFQRLKLVKKRPHIKVFHNFGQKCGKLKM